MSNRLSDAMSKLNVEGSRNSLGRPPPSPGAKRNSGLDSSTINAMFPDAAAAIAKKKAEFTLNDVEGFIAIDETHGELGEIISVQEYPQQLIATVQYKNKEVLFPLNLEIIKGIDVEGGEIYIDLPEGLLDIYLEG